MARHNKLGNSFCQLMLDQPEEDAVKAYLKRKEISAKQLLRYLIRKHLRDEGLLAELPLTNAKKSQNGKS